MACFRVSQWVYFTCLCTKYPFAQFLFVGHSFLTGYFRIRNRRTTQASHTFRNLRFLWWIKFPAKYYQVKNWPWAIIYNVTRGLKVWPVPETQTDPNPGQLPNGLPSAEGECNFGKIYIDFIAHKEISVKSLHFPCKKGRIKNLCKIYV